jgi:hypothetical protein
MIYVKIDDWPWNGQFYGQVRQNNALYKYLDWLIDDEGGWTWKFR